MTKFLVSVSAFAAMSGRLTVDADNAEHAARVAADLLKSGDYPDPDFELVDGGRPALGSEAVDAVRDEDDTDDLFIPPAVDGDPVKILVEALATIANTIGLEEPEAESYEDMQSAYGNGQDVANFENATIARLALNQFGRLQELASPPEVLAVLKDCLAALDLFTGVTDGVGISRAEAKGVSERARTTIAKAEARNAISATLSSPAATPEDFTAHGLGHLIAARDLFARVGAKRTIARIRLAISSAKGAKRHARDRNPRKRG